MQGDFAPQLALWIAGMGNGGARQYQSELL